MKIYSVSASEYLSGVFLGKYGPNNLVADNLLSSVVLKQIQGLPEGSSDLKLRVACRVSLELDFKYTPQLMNLVAFAELQVLQGESLNGILTDVIERYFYHHLVGFEELDDLMRTTLDGIIQHLVYFCISIRAYGNKDVIH